MSAGAQAELLQRLFATWQRRCKICDFTVFKVSNILFPTNFSAYGESLNSQSCKSAMMHTPVQIDLSEKLMVIKNIKMKISNGCWNESCQEAGQGNAKCKEHTQFSLPLICRPKEQNQ